MSAAVERMPDAGAPADAAPQPRIWLVLGDKRGDNAQVEVVARALGWTCEHRYVHVREPYVVEKPRVAPSLHHIDLARSDPLVPPWPDLIITIGRRPSMVALWVRERSGGRTRIVLIGKPSGPVEPYDLVVASAEAVLPRLPNVLPISLPLMRVDETAVAGASAQWRPRLAGLPRPLIGFLVGGPTGPFVFDDAAVDRLLELAAKVRAETGGTAYLTTSRRTPDAVVEALAARLPPGARLFAWTPDATDNPYRALLGLADGFVVTGDSISMLVEVARLGKPLAIAPLEKRGPLRRLTRSLAALAGLGPSRDLHALHDYLYRGGWAVPVGEPFRAPAGPPPDDTVIAASRVRSLLS